MKFKTDDKIVTLICVVGIIFCLFNYFIDVYRVNTRTDAEPIAHLSSKTKSVQRRFKDRLVWDMLRTDSPLYAGDFVRTATLSEAVITFNSGTVLNMSEDSLVEIVPEAEMINLKITSGNVQIKTREKLTLTAGNEKLELHEGTLIAMSASIDDVNNGTNFTNANVAQNERSINSSTLQSARTNTSAQRRISVSIQEGSIIHNKEDGTVQHLTAGSKLIVGEGGKIISDPALLMLTPLANQKILHDANEDALLNFEWNTFNYTKNVTTYISLAYDKNFEYPYKSIVTDKTSASIVIPKRALYWRAYPIDKNAYSKDLTPKPLLKDNIASGMVTVHTKVPIKLLSPFNGTTYTYKQAGQNMRFSWTKDDNANFYRFTLSKNKDLSNAEISFDTKDASVTLASLSDGTWYWSSVPNYQLESKTQNAQNISSFTVLPPITLQAPTLLKPDDKDNIYTANGRQALLFRWQNANGAKSYTLAIADNPNLLKPVATINCDKTYYSLKPTDANLSEGVTWYWAVSFTDSDGNTSPFSEAKSFTTINEPPYYTASSPKDCAMLTNESLKNARFSVETNMQLSHTLEIATDRAFKNIIASATLNAPTFAITSELARGFYYWRIRGKKNNASQTFYETVTRIFYVDDKNANNSKTQIDTNVQMLSLKGSTFSMGKADGTSYEKPVRKITIDDFKIMTNEVSSSLYNFVMSSPQNQVIDEIDGMAKIDAFANDTSSASTALTDGANDLPATNCTWYDAVEFCNRLSMLHNLKPAYNISGKTVTWDKSANGYRLPTEAEWEYAAKSLYIAKDETIWTAENSTSAKTLALHGTSANENSALYNMFGNVSEWCWDIFGYYRLSETVNPTGLEKGSARALRGGNFASKNAKSTASYREGANADSATNYIGLRLAQN